MVHQKTAGYTIVEVTLFLAISSLLLIMALIGTGSSVYTSRFTDSSRSLHSYLQKQYDDILNGVNTRTGQEACNAGTVTTSTNQDAGTSNCLLLGKLMVIKDAQSTVQTYNIIGTEPLNVNYNKADEELIYDFQPQIVTNVGVDTYQIPWQARIAGSKRIIDNQAVDTFALIRSPRSTRIVSYTFEAPASSYNLASVINPAVGTNANNISKPTNFCLRSVDAIDQLSKLVVTGGQGQDAISLVFEAAGGDCNGE